MLENAAYWYTQIFFSTSVVILLNDSCKTTSVHENILCRTKGRSKTNGNDNNYWIIIITETTLKRDRDVPHKLRRGELQGLFIHSGRFRVSSRSRPKSLRQRLCERSPLWSLASRLRNKRRRTTLPMSSASFHDAPAILARSKPWNFASLVSRSVSTSMHSFGISRSTPRDKVGTRLVISPERIRRERCVNAGAIKATPTPPDLDFNCAKSRFLCETLIPLLWRSFRHRPSMGFSLVNPNKPPLPVTYARRNLRSRFTLVCIRACEINRARGSCWSGAHFPGVSLWTTRY